MSPPSSSSESGVDSAGSTSCARARARSKACATSSDFSGTCGREGRGKRGSEGGGDVGVGVRRSRDGDSSGRLGELETGEGESTTAAAAAA